MRNEILFYDCFPKVVPSDEKSRITIRPKYDHVKIDKNRQYYLEYTPLEQRSVHSGWIEGVVFEVPFEVISGSIVFEFHFDCEQEHRFLLTTGDERKPVADFRIYSCDSDLFSKRPFKGDCHMHSSVSDGAESPLYVASACRRIGLDFMALTDHHNYHPSVKLKKELLPVFPDLLVVPGEEIHVNGVRTHIVNFGGDISINDLWSTIPASAGGTEWRPEFLEELKILETGSSLPDGVVKREFIRCKWVFNRIRKAGGLGIFCHPFWFARNKYDAAGEVTDLLLKERIFGALEIVTSIPHDFPNILQTARYSEERAKGSEIPVVGVTDSHRRGDPDILGKFYTVVFSENLEKNELVKNIKNCYSVAVDEKYRDEPHPYGPFRLVKYTLFLSREVFPLHDELCREEGRLLRDWAGGNPAAGSALKGLTGQIDTLYSHLWA